jgi:hypothetical protein
MATKISKRVRTVLANCWRKMVSRCENPKNRDYKNYGARGIRVWRGWLTPGEGMANFISYVTSSLTVPSGMTLDAALTGRGASRLTLDRVDNDGGYQPGNLRLATPLQQSANQRRSVYVEIGGSKLPRTHAARQFGVDSRTAAQRVRLGYADAEAVTLGLGGRTAEARRQRDQVILAMIKGGDLVVDGKGFVFVRDEDGWHLPPLATSGAGRYLGVSITVPRKYMELLPDVERGAGQRYRSSFQHARVVALFHHPLPDDGQYYEVDHVNMRGFDDRPENLRWRLPHEHRSDAHKDRLRCSGDEVDYASADQQATALRALIAAERETRAKANTVDEPPLPTNLPTDTVAELVALVKADADYPSSIWVDPRYEALLPLVLSAAANKPGPFGGVVVECWPQVGGPAFTAYVTALRPGNRVHFGCPKCGRQAFPQPTELRNRLRYPNTRCSSCGALDIASPALAAMIVADPVTGRKPHPSRISAGTNDYVFFRCREDECPNIVRRKVKSLISRGELPTCTEHRRRGDNFKGHSQ